MERFTRIRPGELGLKPARVVKAADFATAHDASAIIEEARREADRILAEAKEVFERERERGFEEGKEAAKLEMADQMITVVSGIVEYLGSVERDMVELVMRAMERILGSIDDRELIIKVVKNALAAVRNEKHLTLRVSPDQIATVKERVNEILSQYPIIADIQIVGDGRLSKTGCILESEVGVIDASLEGQLAAMKTAFERIFGERKQG